MTKNKKNTKNPNPDIDIVAYDIFKEMNVGFGEWIEGGAIVLATQSNELRIRKSLIKSKIEIYEDLLKMRYNEIEQLENKLKELSNEQLKITNLLKEFDIHKAPNVLEAKKEIDSELVYPLIMAEDNKVKQWGLKKITLSQVKEICDKHNAPIKPVLQIINEDYLKNYFVGYNKFLINKDD